MKHITTPCGYLVVERSCGLDVYKDDVFVCELHEKTMADFAYDEKVDTFELDDAIDDEIRE